MPDQYQNVWNDKNPYVLQMSLWIDTGHEMLRFITKIITIDFAITIKIEDTIRF